MSADDPTPMHLRVESDTDRLADVRAFVRDAVASFGGSKAVADDLVQAVDEATCNVMLHGYGHAPGSIDIEAALRDGRIEIRLLDRAPAFDPTAAAVRDTKRAPVPKRPGGMGVGIHLLRTMTDEVRHHVRPDGGNELTLVRSIDDAAREG
jgi:anti-sigma regulatory factor (Ser/Thr protein kinase)